MHRYTGILDAMVSIVLWLLLTFIFTVFIATFVPMSVYTTEIGLVISACVGGVVAYIVLALLQWMSCDYGKDS